MAAAINNISINKALWVNVQQHLISFRFDGMHEDVHFSIAYNGNSPDINLHATRNIGEAGYKPKIEIARISKKDLEELTPHLSMAVLNLILEPITLKPFGRRSKNSRYGIRFFPLNEPEQAGNGIIAEKLLKEFGAITKIKKHRLKVKGDITSCVKNVTNDAKVLDSMQNNFRWLPRKFSEQPFAGFIISRKFTGCAVCINNKWYSIRQNIRPVDFLGAWMEPALAKHLVFKTLMAYARIKNLSSWKESEEYNNSISLFKIVL